MGTSLHEDELTHCASSLKWPSVFSAKGESAGAARTEVAGIHIDAVLACETLKAA